MRGRSKEQMYKTISYLQDENWRQGQNIFDLEQKMSLLLNHLGLEVATIPEETKLIKKKTPND